MIPSLRWAESSNIVGRSHKHLGENSNTVHGKLAQSYIKAAQGKVREYRRIDLAYIQPTRVDGKPMVDLPPSVILQDFKQGVMERGPWIVDSQILHLFADRNTPELRNLGYDRVCVEVSVEDNLFDEVHVRYVNGYVHKQRLEG
ncbi:hypothetical protein Leryth_000780 [Lithospermum erythrorhizon]|nr:hypothetical protein Leryth_000780 [Lithospermum erythrorhizon]